MTLKLHSTPEQKDSQTPEGMRRMTRAEREEAERRLDKMLGITDAVPGQPPFYERATTEEWLTAFQLWVDSRDPDTPVLLDDSREIIYED